MWGKKPSSNKSVWHWGKASVPYYTATMEKSQSQKKTSRKVHCQKGFFWNLESYSVTENSVRKTALLRIPSPFQKGENHTIPWPANTLYYIQVEKTTISHCYEQWKPHTFFPQQCAEEYLTKNVTVCMELIPIKYGVISKMLDHGDTSSLLSALIRTWCLS